MYIIEYKDKWLKKEGKLSFCRVFRDQNTEDDLSLLMDRYLEDLTNLIKAKISNLSTKYNIPEDDIKRLNNLIIELKNASITNGETRK